MTPKEIDPKQLKSLQKSFTILSEKRLLRMLDNFNMAQSDCIKLLPLLFHVNHPMLPGYVDKSTPCGIPNYFPSNLEKKIVKTISRTFEFKSRAYLKFEIAGLYLMGSTGTLGQSVHSDLDLWVCLSESLAKEAFHKLSKKAKLISQWMETKGIELNCYLVFQDQFQDNSKKQLGKDSCGNTQNYLLLDEFYRTAVWLCGRQPLWWLIPPGEEYDDYAYHLINEKRLESGDWIDFGGITEIPAAEYFSAALWQLYKSIESPYKSSVKLLILEIYARYFPQTGLLSTQYKELIYKGITDINQLDPYFLVLGYAEDFLQKQPQRLEFLRRAFYLKTGVKIHLSKDNSRNWRYQQIKKLVERWGWKQSRLDYLNNRINWKINFVLKERSELVRQLTHSYHFISNFARVQGVLDQVSQIELVSLGRMLYAAFERRIGKIDCVNTKIVKNLVEPSVTIAQKNQEWKLYLGAVSAEKIIIHHAVYTSESFFSILAWCVCNQVIDRHCNFQIYSNDYFFSRSVASDLTKDLLSLIGKKSVSFEEKEFDKPAHTTQMGIYINTSQDPLKLEKESGIYSIGEKEDCFNWGQNKINLLPQFDIFWVNSWGEYGCKSFSGEFAWIALFVEYRHILIENDDCVAFFSRKIPDLIEYKKRILQLFRQWNKLMIDSLRKNKSTRYLMSVGDGFLRIDFYGKQVSYKYFHQPVHLLHSLSENFANEVRFQLDANLDLPSTMKKVFNKTTLAGYQIYLLTTAKKTVIALITDGSGYVYYQEHQSIVLEQLINHYQQFFDSITCRLNSLHVTNEKSLSGRQFWHAEISSANKAARFKKVKPTEGNIFFNYSPIQASAISSGKEVINFDFYIEHVEYQFRDYGELVYRKLVKHILAERKDNQNYPIFITDLDLSAISREATFMEYLEFKRQAEYKINSVYQGFKSIHKK
ncbi:class I adenylate cyclase [Aliikangiella sp. IMCC44359]|uniref:class I adenylate cyclase n=1 Tax=Aliikangiella sp. IMCC44359 TaxID=3459125 RepID=UPI00403B19FC